jgi:hypothetical protein
LIYLITIAIFVELHIVFFLQRSLFGESGTWAPLVAYDYPAETALRAIAYVALCLLALVLGLCTRHRRTLVAVGVDMFRLRLVVRLMLAVGIGTSLFLIGQRIGSSGSVFGGTYGDFVLAAYRYSFVAGARTLADVPLALAIFNGYRFRRLDKVLVVAYGVVTLATGNRSSFITYCFIFVAYLILRSGNRLRLRVVALGLALLLVVNWLGGVRQEWEFGRETTRDESLLRNELRDFAPLLISEVLEEYEDQRLYGATFRRAIPLLVPSPARRVLGIEVPQAGLNGVVTSDSELYVFYSVARAAVPMYAGGFSMLAELFMNFGYLGCVFLFLYGVLIKRSWVGLVQSRLRGFFSPHAVFPLMFVILTAAYRNDVAVHLKTLVQVWVIAVAVVLVCLGRLVTVDVSARGGSRGAARAGGATRQR